MMDYIEVSGKTRDDAIMKASMRLGTPSNELDIQVISEGSKGFFGIGSKPFVIRARKKEEPKAADPAQGKGNEPGTESEGIPKQEENHGEGVPAKIPREEPKEEFASESILEKNDAQLAAQKSKNTPLAEEDIGKQDTDTDKKDTDKKNSDKEYSYKRNSDKNNKQQSQQVPQKYKQKEHKPRKEGRQVQIITDEGQIDEIKKKAEKFLADVFQAMGIEVHMDSTYDKKDGSLNVIFSGEDMGILIGKRGQTLDSLQYLAGIVLNKGKNSYVRLKLDTENYRARRKETLENLAKGISSKVRKTKTQVVLEPMNPYERRIIHSTLQGNRYVETFSEGAEPYRHVVVKPKGK